MMFHKLNFPSQCNLFIHASWDSNWLVHLAVGRRLELCWRIALVRLYSNAVDELLIGVSRPGNEVLGIVDDC